MTPVEKFTAIRKRIQWLKLLAPLVLLLWVALERIPAESALAPYRPTISILCLTILPIILFVGLRSWRCPSCNKYLGRINLTLKQCPHCKTDLRS